MIVFKQNSNKIIDVADDFAALIDISENEDLTFEVLFKVSKSQALQVNALKIQIDVATSNVIRPNKLNYKSNEDFVTGILMNSQLIQNNLTIASKTVVASTVVDVTAYINNSEIKETFAGRASKKLKTVSISKKEISRRGDEIPVFQQLAYKSFADIENVVSSSLDFNPSYLAEQMLKTGLDPAQITELNHRSLSANSNLQGILRPNKSSERFSNSFSEKLLNYHIYGADALKIESNSTQLQDDEQLLIRTMTDNDLVEIPATFTIKSSNAETNIRDVLQYHVTFGGEGLDSVTKILDVQKHVSAYNIPDARPKLNSVKIGNKIQLEMTQVSNKAESIQLLKKIIPLDYNANTNFETVGLFSVKPGKSVKLFFDIPENNFEIYRAFSVSANNIFYAFSSVAVNPKKVNSKHKNIVVIPKNIDNGIEIEIRKIPKSVISFQLKAKNLTTHEASYHAVQDPVFVTDVIRTADNFRVIDNSVQKNSIYEYTLDATFLDGQVITINPVIFKYLGTPAGAVTTNISNINVSSTDILDVSFDVNSSVFPNDADNTLAFLKANGLFELYQNDVSGTRDALSGLIAHSIERVNKTTGLRENFGLLTSGTFSDTKLYQQSAVKPLEIGNSYRYEVFVNLRETEQLIKDFVKVKRDLRTTDVYSFNLQKFFHPIVRNEGMLVTNNGLNLKYPQSALEHGSLGMSAVFDVSFENINATITNITAVKQSRYTNNVFWKVQGLYATIDHFLIFKQVHNIRTLLAALHPSLSTVENYVHKLNEKDNGPISYVVVAVYSDYSVSEALKSNSLIVDI